MKCSNENCVWQAYGLCCSESEELLDNATSGIDCPSFLSRYHEEKVKKEERKDARHT